MLRRRLAKHIPGQVSPQAQATAELVLAGVLWGFGFVATVWALGAMAPLALTGWRFVIAASIGFLICWLRPGFRRHLSREQFWLAAPPGLLLAALLVFQTWGLKFTTATKSSFITTLYVLMVPILESTWLRRKLSMVHYFAVAAALIGTLLICDLPGELGLNRGDLLTFIASVFATVHIVWFGVIGNRIKDSFVFNTFQSFWAGVIPLLLTFALEPMPDLHAPGQAWFGFVFLALGSTLVAFALQIHAQKVLSPSLASLLFLLESPFATLFAVLLLSESLQSHQWLGAGLILLAAGLSTGIATEA
jgi:drug/metabolite transporter (DMT)-like permease